jgi:hypothetical protein
MLLPPFIAPKLKLQRARDHIDELGRETAAFLDRKPFRLVIEQPPWWDLSWPIHAWTIRISEAIPLRFSAIIGDAIHNLRTALDLLACDLVRLNDRSIKGVYFPFAADADELRDQIKRKNLNRAAPDVVRLVASLKPYRGGNRALRHVHDLDIQDKHQAVIPVANFIEAPGGTLMFGGHPNKIPNWQSKVTHDGQVIVMMPAVGNLSLGDEIVASFTLIFGEDEILARREVIPALHELAELIAGILESFETFCASRPNRYVPPASEPPKGGRGLIIGSTRPAPP